MKKWTSFCYFSFFSLSAFDYFFRAATKLGNKTKLFSWKSSNHHRDVYFFFLAQTKYSNIFLNFQFLSQNRSIRLSTIRSWKEKLFFFFCLDVLSLAFFFSFGVLFALSGIMVVDFFFFFLMNILKFMNFSFVRILFSPLSLHTHTHIITIMIQNQSATFCHTCFPLLCFFSNVNIFQLAAFFWKKVDNFGDDDETNSGNFFFGKWEGIYSYAPTTTTTRHTCILIRKERIFTYYFAHFEIRIDHWFFDFPVCFPLWTSCKIFCKICNFHWSQPKQPLHFALMLFIYYFSSNAHNNNKIWNKWKKSRYL